MENIVSELLEPRFMVVQNYPYSPFEVGVILEADEKGELYPKGQVPPPINRSINLSSVYKFPNIFESVNWAEGRGVDLLKEVKYVKVISYRGYWIVGDVVKAKLKLNENLDPIGFTLDYSHFQPFYELLPATEEEYLKFKAK